MPSTQRSRWRGGRCVCTRRAVSHRRPLAGSRTHPSSDDNPFPQSNLGVTRKEISMTPLMERMREELVRRNFSPMTIRSYLQAVEVFQQYLGKPLEEAGPDDIRHHQVQLLEDRKLARGTVVIHVSALRFLYVRVLKRREMKEDLPYPKCRKRLPLVLSREEVGQLINSAKNLFHLPDASDRQPDQAWFPRWCGTTGCRSPWRFAGRVD